MRVNLKDVGARVIGRQVRDEMIVRANGSLPAGNANLRVTLVDAPVAVRSDGHFELARDRDGLWDLNDDRVFVELKYGRLALATDFVVRE